MVADDFRVFRRDQPVDRARGYRARSFTSTGRVCTTSPSAEGLISKIREKSADRSANASEFFGGSI